MANSQGRKPLVHVRVNFPQALQGATALESTCVDHSGAYRGSRSYWRFRLRARTDALPGLAAVLQGLTPLAIDWRRFAAGGESCNCSRGLRP